MRGERGPRGDHGQAGDIGPAGAIGPTGRQGSSFLNFKPVQLIAFVLVVFAAVGSVYLIDKAANEDQQNASIRNCESAKLDRIDIARAATAQSVYLKKVLAAASVKQDVKDAASDSIQLWSESANQLRRRLYDCRVWVKDGKRILDRDALLEAQGKL